MLRRESASEKRAEEGGGGGEKGDRDSQRTCQKLLPKRRRQANEDRRGCPYAPYVRRHYSFKRFANRRLHPLALSRFETLEKYAPDKEIYAPARAFTVRLTIDRRSTLSLEGPPIGEVYFHLRKQRWHDGLHKVFAV